MAEWLCDKWTCLKQISWQSRGCSHMTALRFGRKVRKEAMNTSCTCREKSRRKLDFSTAEKDGDAEIIPRTELRTQSESMWDQLKVSVGAKCQGEVNEWRMFACCSKIWCKTWQIGPYKRFVCNIAMLFLAYKEMSKKTHMMCAWWETANLHLSQ